MGEIRLHWLWTLGLVLCANFGCAYFNTFYNAETAFDEAEELGKRVDPRDWPSASQRPKYQNCINKCQLLLEEHPDSDYIDDALFLMAKAQHRLRDYRKSIRNLDNVLANFPRSKFVEEALFLKSLAHLEVGEEQVSLDYLRRLRERFPESKYTEQALFRAGDTFLRAEKHEQALDYYVEFLENFPDHEQRGRVILDVAKIDIELERYSDAVELLEGTKEDDFDHEDWFSARLVRAKALNEVGRSAEAAEIMGGVSEDAAEFDRRGESLVLEGEIMLSLGERDEGVAVLEVAASEFEGTEFETDARHAIAKHALETEGPDAAGIGDQLQLVLDHGPRGDRAQDVRKLRQQMRRYDNLKKLLADADSTAFKRAFDMAELLYLDLEKPQMALEYYRKVISDYDDNPFTARAAYAIGYIESEINSDEAASEFAFDLLRERFPESPQALALDGAVFLEPKPRKLVEPAATADEGGAVEPGSGVDGPPPPKIEPARPFEGRPAADPRRALGRGGPGSLAAPRRGLR